MKRGTVVAIAVVAILISCRGAERSGTVAGAPEEPVAQEPLAEGPEIPEPVPAVGEPPLQRALQERVGKPASEPDEAAPELRRSREAYDQAWVEIVQNGELSTGLSLLEEAIELDPDFGEAWYELGTGRVTLALQELAAGRELDAETFFRKGIAEQRHARELLASGRIRVYDAFELHDKLAELDAELEDADARLADPESVVERLRELAIDRGWLEGEPGEEGPGQPEEEAEVP